MPIPTYSDLKGLAVSRPTDHVLHVQLDRPATLNSMDGDFFDSLLECFTRINGERGVRAVVLSGAGRLFSSGLDLNWAAQSGTVPTPAPGSGERVEREDIARLVLQKRALLNRLQRGISAVADCEKPVIAAVHGACIGGGMDLITACDIRVCTKDTSFSVKEVDIGLAADIGTLQRLPRVVGNGSWVREVCLTARTFKAEEAHAVGLVSSILDTKEALIHHAMDLAISISSKSPIATLGTKHLLDFSQDHPVHEGLEYTLTWNSSMLLTDDIPIAVSSAMKKKTARYANL